MDAIKKVKAEYYERVILFDGVCNLCCAFLKFVHHNDKNNYFQFSWIQSDNEFTASFPVNDISRSIDTIIYIENTIPYYRSTAFLKVVKLLRFPWPLLAVGYVLPVQIRDWLYDRVATNRYLIFGRKSECLVPTGELAGKFIKNS